MISLLGLQAVVRSHRAAPSFPVLPDTGITVLCLRDMLGDSGQHHVLLSV